MSWIAPLLSFYKGGFGVKYYMEVGVTLNEETETKPLKA